MNSTAGLSCEEEGNVLSVKRFREVATDKSRKEIASLNRERKKNRKRSGSRSGPNKLYALLCYFECPEEEVSRPLKHPKESLIGSNVAGIISQRHSLED